MVNISGSAEAVEEKLGVEIKTRIFEAKMWWLTQKVLLPNKESDPAQILGELLGLRSVRRQTGKICQRQQTELSQYCIREANGGDADWQVILPFPII